MWQLKTKWSLHDLRWTSANSLNKEMLVYTHKHTHTHSPEGISLANSHPPSGRLSRRVCCQWPQGRRNPVTVRRNQLPPLLDQTHTHVHTRTHTHSVYKYILKKPSKWKHTPWHFITCYACATPTRLISPRNRSSHTSAYCTASKHSSVCAQQKVWLQSLNQ